MFGLTAPDPGAIVARCYSLADEVDAAARDAGLERTARGIAAELAEVLDRAANAASSGHEPAGGMKISPLVNQALVLVAELAELAAGVGMSETGSDVELLSIPLVLWSGRNHARVHVMASVVNALAALANRIREPAALAQLYRDMTEIGATIAPEPADEGVRTDPTHPWRVLVLNRAIVATRTHDPELIKEAYEAVIEELPDYARHFLAEAMGQMEAIGYPMQVREVISHYYQLVTAPRTVH